MALNKTVLYSKAHNHTEDHHLTLDVCVHIHAERPHSGQHVAKHSGWSFEFPKALWRLTAVHLGEPELGGTHPVYDTRCVGRPGPLTSGGHAEVDQSEHSDEFWHLQPCQTGFSTQALAMHQMNALR